jgi:hypothetical protein
MTDRQRTKSDVLDRLHELVQLFNEASNYGTADDIQAGADTIESLQAEVESKRATLRMAANLLRQEGHEHAAQSVEAFI